MKIFNGDIVRLKDNQLYTVLDCNKAIAITVLTDNNGNQLEVTFDKVVKQYRGI